METEKKKEQKVSVSYTLKATGVNIKKLIDLKMINKEDGEKMKEIHKKAVQKWIESEMNI